jgi:hypothetical protein
METVVLVPFNMIEAFGCGWYQPIFGTDALIIDPTAVSSEYRIPFPIP